MDDGEQLNTDNESDELDFTIKDLWIHDRLIFYIIYAFIPIGLWKLCLYPIYTFDNGVIFNLALAIGLFSSSDIKYQQYRRKMGKYYDLKMTQRKHYGVVHFIIFILFILSLWWSLHWLLTTYGNWYLKQSAQYIVKYAL